MGRPFTVFGKVIRATAAILLILHSFASCGEKGGNENGGGDKPAPSTDVATLNLERSIAITDAAVKAYMDQASGMKMARYYNPFTQAKQTETGSVWMYTSAIEAVNAALKAMVALKEDGKSELHDKHFSRYCSLLEKLVDGLEYYQGTYTLTSFTQTRSWSVYGVNRASRGSARVEDKENVYDDQMWLVRELIESYRITGVQQYLEIAEYLTEYVLDGWDCTVKNGVERGGIPWGPGYYSKHSCSNGPIVSPLVWLSEIYSGKGVKTTYRHIDLADGRTRVSEEMDKSEYYLMFARKVYHWQRQYLRNSKGLYEDNLNTPDIGGTIQYETVNGVRYRKPANLRSVNGPAYTYNTGAMLSGAADLYRVTGEEEYKSDMAAMTDASFKEFPTASQSKQGYWQWPMDGFNTWFNGVLMRAYVDAAAYVTNAKEPVDSFQKNLDCGYANFLQEGLLPKSLLAGWSLDRSKCNSEGMFQFTYAAEYATLSGYLSNN
ncbi:MAG: hydrolase [Bacteroidales bacterium]|nr:hydrolase [Bacteroidales bacterium]